MSSTNTDPTLVLETGSNVHAIAFHTDGKHVLGGSDDGIRRWRLSDGEDVGKQTGMTIVAISVSMDHKWIVCGTRKGASVWDGEMEEKVTDVEGDNWVWAVDVSPDSARFVTGTRKEASIWSITSGQRLVGPLKHDHDVTGIRFSPNGDRIATACYQSIRIFDSHSGDKLVTINTDIPGLVAITPLAWSSDGQRVFSASQDNKIRAFDASTGMQLAESQFLHDRNNNVRSIALAANGKFIATFASHSISLLDTSTLAHISPVIEDGEQIRSVAISPDSSYLATGQIDGKIAIRGLGKILPESYGPFHVSTGDEVQPDKQPSMSGDGKVSRSTPEPHRESSRVESEQCNLKGDNSDLLEREVLSTPAQFDYDDSESLSPASSADGREDEMPPVGSSHPISQSSDFPTVTTTSPAEAHADENPNTQAVESPRRRSIFRKWLERKSDRDSTPPKPRRLSGKSREPADPRPPSHSPARVNATKGPSWMAAARRRPRTVATSWEEPEDKSAAKTTVPKHPKKDASPSGQASTGANEAGSAQQGNNPSQPSAGRVRVTRGPGDAVIAFRIPSWMACGSSRTEDGTDA